LATPRRPRSLSPPKSNPLRDLVSQQSRAAEAARERRRVQTLKQDLPSIIQERVGDQIQKLETRLLSEVKEIGQRAIEESTAAISSQLNGRIESLEKASAFQTQTLASLGDSSRLAEQKVSQAVDQIEQSLAGIVPGFALEPPSMPPMAPASVEMEQGSLRLEASPRLEGSLRMPPMPVGERLTFTAVTVTSGTHPQFRPEPPMELMVADEMDISEIVGKNGFCPKCTSVNVRRANRVGMFESFLRLFSIAPFRCRACRHKFYRF
jgi:uncharacterized coiled-coil protein SlyX